MNGCEDFLRLLNGVAEGEATPDEAMRVAHHAGECTGCRIVLARERRLARMLVEDLTDLTVGDEFVQGVMSVLPEGPPPKRSKRAWRGLKLASFIALLGSTLPLAARQLALAGGAAPGSRLPRMDLESGEGIVNGVAAMVRFAAMALESVGSWMPLHLTPTSLGFGLLAAVIFGTLATLATASSVVALAAGSVVRLTR